MINVLSLIYAKYSQISQRQIFAGSAIICLTHKPSYGPENSFYKFWKKIILGVNNVCI